MPRAAPADALYQAAPGSQWGLMGYAVEPKAKYHTAGRREGERIVCVGRVLHAPRVIGQPQT